MLLGHLCEITAVFSFTSLSFYIKERERFNYVYQVMYIKKNRKVMKLLKI